MLEYLFIAFVVIIGIQLFFYLFVYGSFAFLKKSIGYGDTQHPVSVLICCKNEAENLKQHLPYFLEQEYPNFELVLINDRSSDSTLEVMEHFNEITPGETIKIVDVAENEQFWGSKKYALTLGIKAATHEHLVFTDADCKPNSKFWIAELARGFSSRIHLVLGYGAYHKIKGSILNKLIRFETLVTAVQYFSYSNIGIPYMGVGRNLAYKKSFFFNANGFANHMHIRSGDDDLFVNENATSKNSTSIISLSSFTTSIPKNSFKAWVKQKSRHVSTSNYYKNKHKFLLGLFFTSQLLLWALAIPLLLVLFKWPMVLFLIGLRYVAFYFSIGFSAKKLHEKDLILFAPLLELFLIFTQLFIFIKNLTTKPTHW